MVYNKFARWSDGMLSIALLQNQKQIKEHQRFIELYEKDYDEINDEIARRLKIQLNQHIQKIKDKGMESFT